MNQQQSEMDRLFYELGHAEASHQLRKQAITARLEELQKVANAQAEAEKPVTRAEFEALKGRVEKSMEKPPMEKL